jgi:transcriptional regulator with GAF, ATPase, and Fis domain
VELSGQVSAGRFRADLYHRLAVIVLEVPPLRTRGQDILVLAEHFLDTVVKILGHVHPLRALCNA